MAEFFGWLGFAMCFIVGIPQALDIKQVSRLSYALLVILHTSYTIAGYLNNMWWLCLSAFWGLIIDFVILYRIYKHDKEKK